MHLFKALASSGSLHDRWGIYRAKGYDLKAFTSVADAAQRRRNRKLSGLHKVSEYGIGCLVLHGYPELKQSEAWTFE